MIANASLLGLDIGGSTSRAWLASADGTIILRATAPSASLAAAGREQAESVIAALLAELGLGTPAAPLLDAICVGTAGSGAGGAVGWVVERFSRIVRPPARERIAVVNDSRLALAAEGLVSGIALIAGTGSTAIGVLGECEERAGGWGYLLGDDGSGYWVVREAVRQLCLRRDEGQLAGALGDTLFAQSGATDTLDLIQRFHEDPAPARWAGIAPALLDSPDPAAETILAAAADSLAALVAQVAGRLHHPPPVPVVLAGGLVVNHAALGAATVEAIVARLGALGEATNLDIRVSTRPPIEGALHLADALARRLDGHVA
ncbi:MAG: N-acetylglucosamine kinase [Acidimicrobiales bacterium]